MWAEIGATVTLVRCTFADNTITGTHYNSAVLSVNAVKNVPDAQMQDTIVRLDQCSFTRNYAWNLLVVNERDTMYDQYSAVIYSDDADLEVLYVSESGKKKVQRFAEQLSAAPAGRQGITSTSVWLWRAQQVRSSTAS
jgi:hypothetical protein